MAPSAAPAPTSICSSSMKRTRLGSFSASSIKACNRSSNSPRYLVPAMRAGRSSIRMRISRIGAGTLPRTMRRASPSARAVLPTPAGPIRQGLFLFLRISTPIIAPNSCSRPIKTSLALRTACPIRSTVYFSGCLARARPFSVCRGRSGIPIRSKSCLANFLGSRERAASIW